MDLDSIMSPPSSNGNYINKASELAESGESFRVLDLPFAYYKYWSKEDTPVSILPTDPLPMDQIRDKDPKFGDGMDVDFWWAVPIYIHDRKNVFIFQIKQKSIINGLKALNKNPKWGGLTEHDCELSYNEDEKKYTITPLPKEELSEEAIEVIADNPINLKALLSTKEFPRGGNPFEKVVETVPVDDIPDFITSD